MTNVTYNCAVCRKVKPNLNSGGTGYAERNTGEKVCYFCCAIDDEKYMRLHGKIVLYLTGEGIEERVSNWPGTLKFPLLRRTTGNHNMTGKRVDIWFNGPDKFIWHGVKYGENTQIVRCNRTKGRL